RHEICEIRRKHEGRDQGEIRLRSPVEKNPADDGGLARINRRSFRAASRKIRQRHEQSHLLITNRRFACRAEIHIAFACQAALHVVACLFARSIRGFPMSLSTINCCKGFAIVALAALLAWQADAQERRFYTPPPLDSVQAVAAEHGMVVAQEKLAAQI